MYIILSILIFGILIATHELGHFTAAKLFGVRVNEFSICMGPALWKKKIGETTYAVRCIPIGGYCAMEGEDEDSDDPRAFTSAKPWKRAVILVAGAAMNFITGVLVLVILYSTVAGFTTPRIVSFSDNCALNSAQGLQEGDILYKIDGKRVYQYSDVGLLLSRNKTGVYDIVVKRDGEKVVLENYPMEKQPYEQEDGSIKYLYGMYFGTEPKTIGSVLKNAWYSSLDYARMVWLSLGDLVRGMVSVDDMSGPVGIVSIMAETSEASPTTAAAMMNLANLGAFIAINLAVMNLLPIPALDGGRVFFLLINWIIVVLTKKKMDPKYEGYIHAAGMVLLLGFIGFITLKDIWKLIVGV